jgi:hypothetical protein
VELDQRVDEHLAQAREHRRRHVDALGQLPTEHRASDALHHVERRAHHREVLAVRERPRRLGPARRERRQDAVLAAHVVRGLHLVAERRSAQDELDRLARGRRPADQVREVRVPARKLRDLDRAVEDARELAREERRQPGGIELLAHADGARLVDRRGHAFTP